MACSLSLAPLASWPRHQGRTSGKRRNSHGTTKTPATLEEIAVLPVHCGVLHAGEQQAVAVESTVLRVVLEQTLSDFLVVRVVAEAASGQRKLLHQGLAIAAAPEIRLGPSDGLPPVERDNGRHDPLQKLRLTHALGAGRSLGQIGTSLADVFLMPGAAIEE